VLDPTGRRVAFSHRCAIICLAVTADQIIETLGLREHPEGGHFRETWRDLPEGGGRGSGTAIYYLLRHAAVSAWHRVDATEIWHFYAGSPLELRIRSDGVETVGVLGNDLARGQRPQLVVPAGAWQSARSRTEDAEGYTLVGCTVSPAFRLEGFELAPKSFEEGG
jgi:predicted cupin superfamily sugar epimerase